MTSTLPPTLSAPPTSISPPSKYRFSAVDDLQLPPALSVTTETPLEEALTMALEREYSQLTVISPEHRKLLGYLDIPAVLSNLHNGKIGQMSGGAEQKPLLVKDVYKRFDRRKSVGYQVITPDTSLDILDEFLKKNAFAIVTDESRKFVLGVATRADLEEFAKRRVF